MKRRKLVALVAASVLGTLTVVVFATLFFVTHTTSGHERVRRFVQPLLSSLVKGGSVYVGHLSGNLLNQVVVDSFAIRDKRGELLVSTGRVTASYNWRDLVDYRILIHRALLEHPYVHLIQHENGVWNFNEIFAKGGPSKPKSEATRGIGDYIVLDSVTLHDATFLLTQPWHPDDSLHGAVLDSVIRAHVTDPEKAVAKTFDGYARTYAWRSIKGLVTHARLADPDSDKRFGQEFRVASLSADEFAPTFKFRNVTANARRLADSLWLDVPHFDMPASTGHASGRVWWGGGLPTRYDIAVRGDSVSLNDVNWVYPDLPRTGGGSLDLAIANDPRNLHVVDFKISNMDVRSTKSHLTGAMSFGTNAPVLLVRNVDLRANPVDFDLLRTLNGKPFAEDWQGQLYGTVKGRGGPLTNFVVDDVDARFEDAHVRGAVSTLRGKGELDILKPAYTAFHGFDVNAGSIDLRTIEFLFPAFPRLGGTVSGTARLDSSWLDVRFSNADFVHRDGPGEPSHVTGSGRITYGTPFMIYDVSLNAEPLSFTTLARSYASLPLRGTMSGPIHAKGSSPDLELSTSLEGSAGSFSFDGRLDIDTIGGVGAHGTGQFATVNLATLLGKPNAPKGTLSGHYDLDVAGPTAAALEGAASLDLERTMIDSIRVYPSYARLRFADGRLLVDSLRLHTAVATLFASRGGIGLPGGKPDSLRLDVVMDSLGGARPLLPRRDTTVLAAAADAVDSLAGRVEFHGWARGTLDTLGLRGTLSGVDLFFNGTSAHDVVDSLDLQNILKAPTGTMRLSVDSAVYNGIALDSIGGTLRADEPTRAQFTVGALSHNGPTVAAAGIWHRDTDSNAVLLDRAELTTSAGAWHLAGPAHLVRDRFGTRVDSLVVRNGDSAIVTLSANVPDTGAASVRLRGQRLPMRDFALAAQLADSVSGIGDVDVAVTGTKASPVLTGAATITGIKRNGVELDRIASTVRMNDRRAAVNLAVIRQGDSALVASADLPVDFRLFGLKLRNDSVSGHLAADTTDLSLLQLVSPSLKNVKGKLIADLSLYGTLHPILLRGDVKIANGSADVPPLGKITLTNINGGISGAASSTGQDSISVDVSAVSGGTIRLAGWVKNSGQKNAAPSFDLFVGANDFHAFSDRNLADLTLSTLDSLHLAGDLNRPVLTGSLLVDRGSIYLPDRDIARKQTADVLADIQTNEAPTGLSTLAAIQKLRTNLQIPNLTVRLAENEVRLRSAEANVRLAGEVRVLKSAGSTRLFASRAEALPGLAVEGALTTVGGTYNLNLGLVQREFQVLPGGTVTFNGAPNNPTLNIFAQYNVKQYRDRDLEIRVNLLGPVLPYPEIDISSNQEYISTSDLLSYLLTGRPGFDFASNPNTQQVVASFLAPTVSAYTADKLRQSFGSVFDAFRFELGGANNAQNPGAQAGNLGLSSYFYGATIGAEKQFANNLFLSVNTGLCQFDPNRVSNNSSINPLANLGAKVEYRFKPTLSGQLTYDPSTQARTCSNGLTTIGVVPTPPQFGLSLSHTWRF